MKLTIQQPKETATNLLRKAGYSEYRDRNTGKFSFSKRLGRDFFPKFHLYTEEAPGQLTLNLHIDQKQASYEGSHMHSGEYEGELVENELQRIKDLNDHLEAPKPEEPKGFFSKLFG